MTDEFPKENTPIDFIHVQEEIPLVSEENQSAERCHVCGVSDEAEGRKIIHIALTGDGSVTLPMCRRCAPVSDASSAE